MVDTSDLTATLVEMGLDRPLAHRLLFAHRHQDLLGRPVESAPFHDDMARDWSGPEQFHLDKVFRGGAKSTIGEESVTIGGLYGDFSYCLIVGANQPKAMERLAAIRHELKTNELIQGLFGADADLETDTDKEIVTTRGVRFQALGRGQSMRGVKHLHTRPDFVWIDDLEDRADVATPEARKKVWDWLTRDLLPACDPMGRVRMSATPLHPEAAPERLERDPAWQTRSIPIYYLDLETGEPRASWPARWPIEACLKLERSYRSRGELENFKQEYMVQAEAPETKPFKREMINLFPQVRTWQAAYSMTDPARTAHSGSATTGHAVWSWINGKLVIWDAWAKRILPDAIIQAVFDSHAEYRTVWCGVEEDGLNQFLLQPFRQKMVADGVTLPLRPVKAPNSKLDFIRGLQPFFMGREVQFAKPMPDLEEQLLGFPTGAIDAPNALAYALKLRPGAPIYDDFGPRHIAEDLRPASGRPVWLCLNATQALVTGCALQIVDGSVRVFADFVREGDPGSVLGELVSAAQLEVGRSVRLTAGPRHYDRHNNVGLIQAAKRLPQEVRPGFDPIRGRAVVRRLLQRDRSTQPMVLIGTDATWTLNAFVGGYSRSLVKAGQLSDQADDGPYRVLMEGIEAFAGLLEAGSPDSTDDDRRFAVTSDGRRYTSMLGNRGR